MNGFRLPSFPNAAPTILCLGAHSDDIEIGCGATLLHLKQAYPGVRFHWVVFSAVGQRREEAQQSAARFTANCQTQVVLLDFRDGYLPYVGAQVKDQFETLKEIQPDLIFTHWKEDAHQDHRLIAELTWNTFRNHTIAEYEIPKFDGDLGRPNLFVPLQFHNEKVDYLMEGFESQRSKRWYSRETFLGLMRLRGMECNAASGYAEAFFTRKVVLDVSGATGEL